MRVEDLERELRVERPEPSLDFARRLDEWAEAGFPRERGLGPSASARAGVWQRLRDRLAATPPRRLALPAGALATLAIVTGIAVTQGGGADDSAVPTTASTTSAAAAAESATPPAAADQQRAGGVAGSASGGAAAQQSTESTVSPDVAPAPTPTTGSGGTIAHGADHRLVDAAARLSLGASADDVQGVANGVVEVTDRYDGVVTDSQVTTDQAGARASFELQIPFKHLDAALSDLSGLADVISRTQAGEDITAKAVRDRKQLAATLTRIADAKVELIRADTAVQRRVIQARIDSLEATADAQRTALNGVQRRARYATVSVEINSSESSGSSADGGDWSLGDGVHDAGRVLEVIAGGALVALAVIVPLALVGGLIALFTARYRRRSRERALDGVAARTQPQ